jgi:quercetin dioxygenase-like cupin family protein
VASSQPYVVEERQRPVESWNDPVRGVVTWRTLLSGDRTPTDSLTLGVAELHAGDADSARLHRHAQAEAYYVLAGRGVLTIEDVDHPLAPGVTAFIPGGRLHGARAVGPEPLRILYVFAADSFDQIHYAFPDRP